MKKVLVCDDDKNILYLITYVLTGLGWEVCTSQDCIDILGKTAKHQPSVIIMDNIIPDVGGIASIQILKSNPISKNIPVILCTSSSNISALAEEAGSDFYLWKPVNVKKLESLMSDVSKILV